MLLRAFTSRRRCRSASTSRRSEILFPSVDARGEAGASRDIISAENVSSVDSAAAIELPAIEQLIASLRSSPRQFYASLVPVTMAALRSAAITGRDIAAGGSPRFRAPILGEIVLIIARVVSIALLMGARR